MVSTGDDLEDEGFGFFGENDGLAAAPASAADVVDLGATLTIGNIEQWHSQLDKTLGGSSNVRLEAGALEQIDGTGLQLLCSFVKSARVLDVSVGWGGTSTWFLQSASYFGANEVLGIDVSKNAA